MAREKKNATPLQLWFEEAWEGWIRPLGLMVLLAIGYVLYKFDIVERARRGPGRGAGDRGRRHRRRRAAGAAAGARSRGNARCSWPWSRPRSAAWSTRRCARRCPGRLYAEAVLTNDKPSQTLTTGAAGPYELMVSGHFKEAGRSDAEATYSHQGVDNGGGSDEASGEIARKLVTIRSRKGSSSSVTEQNEEKHRLGHVRGPAGDDHRRRRRRSAGERASASRCVRAGSTRSCSSCSARSRSRWRSSSTRGSSI